MDKQAFYLFEKKIIRTFFYKVYVDGHRLCFAKIPYLDQRGRYAGTSFVEGWIGFIIGLLIGLLMDFLSEKKFKHEMDQRERIERQYDEWSKNEMDKLLSCKHNFSIDMKKVERVVFVPSTPYEHKGIIRFHFNDDQERTFLFSKVNKLERLERIFREAFPELMIEKKNW